MTPDEGADDTAAREALKTNEPGEGEKPETNGHDAQADEARARVLGWRPEDQYRGPNKWLPAGEFVAKVEGEMPVLRERVRFLGDEVTKRDGQLSGLTSTITEQGKLLKEMLGRVRKADQEGYERARREALAEVEAAAARADVPAHKAALTRLEEVDKAKPAAVAEEKPVERQPLADQQPQPSPVVARWAQENDTWFNPKTGDPEAAEDAISLFATNVRRGMSEEVNLAAVRKKIETLHPHLFENQRRAAPAVVHTPSGERRNAGAKKEKTLADVPTEDRALMQRTLAAIPGMTQDEWIKTYFREQA